MFHRLLLVVALFGGAWVSAAVAQEVTLLPGTLKLISSPMGPPSLLGFRADMLEASLCGRGRKTVEAADCKISAVRNDGPGTVVRFPESEIPAGRAVPVSARVAHFSGYSLTSLETSCGRWDFTWALAPAKSDAPLALWLEPAAAGESAAFAGRMDAMVRWTFLHATEGTVVVADRPLGLDLEGTWDLLPPDWVPAGETNLRLAGPPGRAVPAIPLVGDCVALWLTTEEIAP
jgi:hypothetical protein